MEFYSAKSCRIRFIICIVIATLGMISSVYAQSNSWSTRAPMPTARGQAAAGVIGGKIYVVGGGTNYAVVNTNEMYNPTTNKWSERAAMPTARWFAASAVVDQTLYVIGGMTTLGDGGSYVPVHVVEAYTPATNTWSTKAPLPVSIDRKSTRLNSSH